MSDRFTLVWDKHSGQYKVNVPNFDAGEVVRAEAYDRLRAENERMQRVVEAAGVVWTWVGPGYPELDDEKERDRFMASVRDVAHAWFALQRSPAEEQA